jgi:hypothetical protein
MIMMGGNKKKLASMIVAHSSGEPSAEKNEKAFKKMAQEPEGLDADLHSVAGDVMKAFQSGNVSSLKDALKSFVEICDSMPHLEGEHEDIGE